MSFSETKSITVLRFPVVPASARVPVDTCTSACVCVYMFMRICVSVHACVSMLVHVCMCERVGVCLPAHQGEENQPCVGTCDVHVFYTHCLYPLNAVLWALLLLLPLLLFCKQDPWAWLRSRLSPTAAWGAEPALRAHTSTCVWTAHQVTLFSPTLRSLNTRL